MFDSGHCPLDFAPLTKAMYTKMFPIVFMNFQLFTKYTAIWGGLA